MKSILQAKEIHKSFNKTKEKSVDILKGVSLDVEEGKITIIVGASGAGKSTLLHILGGLDKPDSGSINIGGTDIASLNDEKLSRFRNGNIGFVFQFHHLLPEFTALENVNIPKLINGTGESAASKKSKELLELVGLSDRLEHKPAELSGGEQQRVAVARALANEPAIVFADEPTGNLDSKNSELLHKLFIDLKERFNLTLLIVTHNPELVKLADKLYEMRDGLLFEKND